MRRNGAADVGVLNRQLVKERQQAELRRQCAAKVAIATQIQVCEQWKLANDARDRRTAAEVSAAIQREPRDVPARALEPIATTVTSSHTIVSCGKPRTCRLQRAERSLR